MIMLTHLKLAYTWDTLGSIYGSVVDRVVYQICRQEAMMHTTLHLDTNIYMLTCINQLLHAASVAYSDMS
jgi:hypothetical protein